MQKIKRSTWLQAVLHSASLRLGSCLTSACSGPLHAMLLERGPLLDSATSMAVKCCRSMLVALLAALAWRTLRVAPQPLPPPPPPPPPLPDFLRTADGLAVLQPAELRLFVGRDHQLIYLAIIGDVFDVTTGSRHTPTPSVHMSCCQPSLNAWSVQALRTWSLIRALCGVRLLARVRHRPRRWQWPHGRPLWPQ